MRILVLGGTAWLGGAIAGEALLRGHEVACLARGEAGEVPEGAHLIRADRDRPDAYAEAGGHWDAVLDVARHPGHVRGAVAALDAERYVFVSTGNVYADRSTRHGDESLPLLPLLDGDRMASMDDYGSAKVACEAAVLAAFGDRALVARAGLIGGPGDTSGRSGYWPWRFAHPVGDAVLVPDAPQRSTELIDVRDLAAWLVRCAEDGTGGVLDAVGLELPLAEHLTAAGRAADSSAAVAAAPEAWLAEQGVAEWAGPRSLPLWLADPDWEGFTSHRGDGARAAGLTHRPLDETLRDVLAWEEAQPEHPHGAGLADDDERELLGLLSGR